MATVYSGANPGEFRGPEHHWGWMDEFAKYARARDVYDNLNMGLRLEYVRKGSDPRDREPQCLITTTPRPIAVMRELVKKKNAVVTHGSTYENRANLAESFLQEIRDNYEGTRIGRQEIGGDLLDDVPGALWSREWFDRPGFRQTGDLSLFDLIAVAIDPAASSTESSDETGIVVMGLWRDAQGRRRFHVLADRSIYGTAKQRARAAILAMLDFEANTFVVETNNGGDWIPAVINAEWEDMKRDPSWSEKLVGMPRIECVTATRGKHTRAEPISTLYEQLGTVTHEPGLEELEDQMVTWSPLLNERSPDRMDALVWAGTYLSTAKVFVAT
jgi:phage terminase large subunit-like protein